MLNWEWYGDTNVVRIFLHCLLKANYQDRQWKGITIERGQFVTGREILAKETGLTIQQVRTALDKLKSTGEITIKVTNKYSIVTICNYETYQGCEIESNQQNNHEITNKQPANNQQITSNQEKEEKKNQEKNNKEDIQNNRQKESISKDIPKKGATFSMKEQLISDGLDKELVEAYMLVRRNKRAPDSIIAYKGLTREAEKAGVSIEAAITECVERNWVGFKAEWYNRVNNNNNGGIQHDNRQNRRRESSVSDFSQQETLSF